MITFEEFRATRKEYHNLGPILHDELLNDIEGYIYLNSQLHIEKTNMTFDRTGAKIQMYYLQIIRFDWISSDLKALEEKLYQFACDEGYFN